jgi:hypothetical protein
MKKARAPFKLILTSMAFIFCTASLASANFEKGSKATDEDYTAMIKTILVKNNLVAQESDVQNIKIKQTVASLAFFLANATTERDQEFHVRQVEFVAKTKTIVDAASAVKKYTCNLVVEIRGQNDLSGSHLEACYSGPGSYSSFSL